MLKLKIFRGRSSDAPCPRRRTRFIVTSPKKRICVFHRDGYCKKGEDCDFSHDLEKHTLMLDLENHYLMKDYPAKLSAGSGGSQSYGAKESCRCRSQSVMDNAYDGYEAVRKTPDVATDKKDSEIKALKDNMEHKDMVASLVFTA